MSNSFTLNLTNLSRHVPTDYYLANQEMNFNVDFNGYLKNFDLRSSDDPEIILDMEAVTAAISSVTGNLNTEITVDVVDGTKVSIKFTQEQLG